MTSLSDLPIRDDLRGRSPYGAPQQHVAVRLNVNENGFGVPDAAVDEIAAAVREAVRGAHRYPDREFSELRSSLAQYLGGGVRPEQVWAGNGSNEVLQQVLQAFGGPGRSLLGFAPTYSMYPLLAAGTGTAWIPADRDDRFELSAETAARAVREHRPDVVVLCTPNNPTGTPLGLDVVEAVLAEAPGIVVVDEAYQEFDTGGQSAVTLLDRFPRLLVSRTMSKAFAFAGVRLGYLAAAPAVTDALRLVRLPYHLSALTQAAAVAALRHAGAMLANVAAIAEQRDRISATLAELGYDPYRSAANFVLFGGVDSPAETFGRLLEDGILVRDVGLAGTLRVTAGTEPETTAFLDAMARLGSKA